MCVFGDLYPDNVDPKRAHFIELERIDLFSIDSARGRWEFHIPQIKPNYITNN